MRLLLEELGIIQVAEIVGQVGQVEIAPRDGIHRAGVLLPGGNDFELVIEAGGRGQELDPQALQGVALERLVRVDDIDVLLDSTVGHLEPFLGHGVRPEQFGVGP
jgi:hypothetical protein